MTANNDKVTEVWNVGQGHQVTGMLQDYANDP